MTVSRWAGSGCDFFGPRWARTGTFLARVDRRLPELVAGQCGLQFGHYYVLTHLEEPPSEGAGGAGRLLVVLVGVEQVRDRNC